MMQYMFPFAAFLIFGGGIGCLISVLCATIWYSPFSLYHRVIDISIGMVLFGMVIGVVGLLSGQ
jgi:hypothetical protein